MITSLGNKRDIRKLARAWSAKPGWDDAIIIPSSNLGKDIQASIIPLPAVLLRQVPLLGVQDLLDAFLSRMNAMITSGDLTIFP